MRIEAYTQVQQLYQPKKPAQGKQSAGASRSSDQLQISSRGMDYQSAKAAVANVPDVREELTASIKARVQNGTYAVDMGAFADKLLQRYEEMR